MAERTARERLEKKIVRAAGRAIGDFRMIQEDDRVLVALSGGKDSWALLHALHVLRRRSPVRFEVDAVTVHPGYPDFDPAPVEARCRALGYRHFVEPSRMYEIIEAKREPGSSYCAICSRLRRGILYGTANREGYTKIALGHHADDLIETLLLAELFTGEIKSMPPLLRADDGRNVVIRPLCYCFEEDLAAFAQEMGFPVVSCGCPVAGCTHTQRHRIKALLKGLENEHPGVKANLLSSLGRVRLRYLMVRDGPAGVPKEEEP
jgi:tRNA 2-thiocytidine biosynthesis protein TtcA